MTTKLLMFGCIIVTERCMESIIYNPCIFLCWEIPSCNYLGQYFLWKKKGKQKYGRCKCKHSFHYRKAASEGDYCKAGGKLKGALSLGSYLFRLKPVKLVIYITSKTLLPKYINHIFFFHTPHCIQHSDKHHSKYAAYGNKD